MTKNKEKWNDSLDDLFRKAYQVHKDDFNKVTADHRFKKLTTCSIFDEQAFKLKVKALEMEIEAAKAKAREMNNRFKNQPFKDWKDTGAIEYLELALLVHNSDYDAIPKDDNFVLLKNYSGHAIKSKRDREILKKKKKQDALEAAAKTAEVGEPSTRARTKARAGKAIMKDDDKSDGSIGEESNENNFEGKTTIDLLQSLVIGDSRREDLLGKLLKEVHNISSTMVTLVERLQK